MKNINNETQMVRVNKEAIPKLKEMKYDFRVDSLTAVIDELIKMYENNTHINILDAIK